MAHNENKSTVLVRVPKAWVIAMVAEQIKGKILFPKKIEEAKSILANCRFVKKK